ncbi:MAG: chondroitinase-B domain-containing protein [Verrucomicrobiota bacterium]
MATSVSAATFDEVGGLVVMEAEHASSRTTAVAHSWVSVSDAAASGGSAIQTSPDDGTFTDDTTGPVANFKVSFSTLGTYYLWVRMTGPSTSSDSVHAGFKSSLLTTGGYGLTSSGNSSYIWTNTVGGTRITLSPPSAGVHSVNIWMREDGAIVDKIILTTDAGYVPSGNGPAESVIINKPTITSAGTAGAGDGTIFTYNTVATNSPTNYSATGLPSWLVIDPLTGVLEGRPPRGTPVGNATLNVTVVAGNADGTGSKALTVTIADEPAAYTDLALFKTAVKNATPGQIIILANGTYANPSSIKLETSGGTDAQPVVIRAQEPGQVTFTGLAIMQIGTTTLKANYVTVDGFVFTNGRPASSGGAIHLIGDDLRVTECAVIDFSVGTNVDSSTNWFRLQGVRQRLDHCYFKGKRGKGALVSFTRVNGVADHHRVDHNAFIDFQTGGSTATNGFETLLVGSSSDSLSDSFSTIEWNYFNNCGADAEIISNKSGYNTYRYNTFVNCSGQLSLRIGPGCIVESNFLYQSGVAGQGGIRMSDRDHTVRYNYVAGVRQSPIPPNPDTFISGLGIFKSDNAPLGSASYWPVQDVLIERNSIINCDVSFLHGAGKVSSPNAPVSIDFVDNVARTGLAGGTNYPIVRIDLAITSPTYTGEVYYGGTAGNTGFPTLPSGVSDSNPALTTTVVGPYTLYLAAAGTIGTDLQHLFPLLEDDVGPNDYDPVP